MRIPNDSIDEDIYLYLLQHDDKKVWFEELARAFAGIWYVPDLIYALDRMENNHIISQGDHKTRIWLNQ